MNLSLKPEAIQMNEVEVTARAIQSNEAALLSFQQKSPVVTDGISAELMNHAASSDAGDALKRVTGISVVSDRYVFVRGLGERYSSTQLNGAQIPSPEPHRRVVPMDIFPAGLLENIQTAKTFSPDQPGDFAGGSVQIVTRDFPERAMFSVSTSGSFNSQTTFKDFYTYPGSSTDFLGFDDGRRALPDLIRTKAADQSVRPRGRFSTIGFTEQEMQAFGRSFENVWSSRTRTAPVNQGYGLTLGNALNREGREFGYIFSFNYSNDFETKREERNTFRMGERPDGNPAFSPFTAYDVRTSINSVLWGAIFNSSFRPSPMHKLSLKTMYNRSAEDEGRTYEGFNSDRNTDFRNSGIRYIDRGLFSGQLIGEHHLRGLENSELTWRGTLSLAARNEPDNREVVYERRNDRWVFRDITQSGSRFFFDLKDDERGGALDWSIPFKAPAGLSAKFKVGGLWRDKDRSFDSRRFRFIPAGLIDRYVDLSRTAEELFSPENIAPDRFTITESTRATDNYLASQELWAGYAMVDMPVTHHLRLIGGARFEDSDQTVTTFDPFTPTAVPIVARLKVRDLLPGVNLVYRLSDRANLRWAYSRTLTRPDLREMAPFEYQDFVGGLTELGNPNLKHTRIDNFDTRWEVFPRPGELIAVSAFYKKFHTPIEQIVQPSAEVRITYENAKSARNYGAEMEFRKALDFLSPALKRWSVNTNLTLVRSQVALDERGIGVQTSQKRPLQGQSPYLVNAMLAYDDPGRGASVSLFYNVFGKRIDEVGELGVPDVYEQSRHKVDFTYKQYLNPRFNVKFTAKNLLDPDVLFKQGPEVYHRYRSGRSFSLGLGYSL